uniref:RNA helicase n=1 Tax=Culex tarsalis TaxID=7177 RepID=A0A1Q3EZY4_CULTA
MAGHNLQDERPRTEDIEFDRGLRFEQMFLSEQVVRGLARNNFVTPSPIQARAIPLGKLGLDLLVQAKAGTGKTLVFSVLILEAHNPDVPFPQSLTIVPTREIAVQIEQVLNRIAYSIANFRAQSFIGGLDVTQDRKNLQNCTAVVGTPGRIWHLIKSGLLNMSHIKMLVLDEADSLIAGTVQPDVDQIIKAVPKRRQTVVCSATFYKNRDRELLKYMKEEFVGVTPKKEVPVLHGIRQFVRELPETKDNIKEMMAKINELNAIFKKLPFSQCVLFTNSQTKAESYSSQLTRIGWPTEVIRGGQEQRVRLKTVENLKQFRCRILSATDVIARGIDAENVNLVINVDVPVDQMVYLHRIGRAGRFGTQALAITLTAKAKDTERFRKILFDIGGNDMFVYQLPKEELQQLWNFNEYGERYPKFYASKLEQELRDSSGLEPIVEVDSRTELDRASAETLTDSLDQPVKASSTVVEVDSIEQLQNPKKGETSAEDEQEDEERVERIIPMSEPVPEAAEGQKKTLAVCDADLERIGKLAPSNQDDLFLAAMEKLELDEKEEQPSVETKSVLGEGEKDRDSRINQLFLDAMSKVDAPTEKDESSPQVAAPADEVDKLFLAAMEKFDSEEAVQDQSEQDPPAAGKLAQQEQVNGVEAKVVNEMFLAAMGRIDAMEPTDETANGVGEGPDAVADKLFLAAMDKLGFGGSDDEAIDLSKKKEISPAGMDKFDSDGESLVSASGRRDSTSSCSTPESPCSSDSSFSSNATKKVEVGSNFTTPNSRVQEIRGAGPAHQISSSTSDNSELSQLSESGGGGGGVCVPAEPNCLPLEVNNDALFAKIMEQKELEAEHQLQRPFQFSIDGCSLEVHDDPISDRDINSRKGSVPDVVPSGITLDPSRLQNRPPSSLAAAAAIEQDEVATFDLNSNTAGSNHGSVFEHDGNEDEEAVVPQENRPKRIRFQDGGASNGSADSLSLKSNSNHAQGEPDPDPLALPPIVDATVDGTDANEDASSYSSEYDSESSNSSFFDQRDEHWGEAGAAAANVAPSAAVQTESPKVMSSSKRPKVSKRATSAYHRTYSTWSNQYWNQMTMIRDYARFAVYARQGQ